MNTFQGGAIYWSLATGAHVVYGAIGGLYNSLGGPASFLGLPISDELGIPGGRVSYFQDIGRAIVWTPSRGAYVVYTVVADHPAAANNTAYSPVSGTLFGANGPSYLDVQQGDRGRLLAAGEPGGGGGPGPVGHPEHVHRHRHHHGERLRGRTLHRPLLQQRRSAQYVTVDTELPSGGGYYDHPVNGVLWVALAEKAYAQANGAGIVTTNEVGSDSYAALDGGGPGGNPSWALQAITGKSASDFPAINPTNIATAWNAGELIVLDSSTNAGDNLIVGDSTNGTHSYAVIGYNASSSTPFELYNPWGLSSVVGHTSNYNGHQVYDGPFWFSSSLISQDFAYQNIGTGTAAGLDGHDNMPLVLTEVPHKARAALYHDLALDALQQYDFDLSWVA